MAYHLKEHDSGYPNECNLLFNSDTTRNVFNFDFSPYKDIPQIFQGTTTQSHGKLEKISRYTLP